MSKFFCVLNADGSTSCVNADQIVSVHDRGGKCRIHLLDGREINLNCGMRTLMRAAGMEPHWLNLRPNSEYGEVYSSFPGSETKGSPPASTGPVEAPAVGSYEGDAQGVVPARHTSAEEIRARVAGAPATFSAQEARRMSEIKVAHELMSARERKSRVLAPLVDSINRSWAGRGTPAAPSEPVSQDKSAPPESPVGHPLPNGHAQPSGCSVDPFDSRSAPDVERSNTDVEQLPNSSAQPGEPGLEHPFSFPWISDKIRLSIRTGRPITEADILNLLNAAELRVGVQRESIEKLERELAGHRRLAEKAGYAPGEPLAAPVVTEPPGPCDPEVTVTFEGPLDPDECCPVAPPSLLTSAGEILDFRKDICLAVLSKSHATIPEGLAEYSRKLAEEVMLTKPIS